MEYLQHQRVIRHAMSGPFIWLMIVPLVILDIFAEFFHRICFPLFGLPYLKRSRYIRIDRQKLRYLSPLQKFFCVYCGYANGLLHYTSIIAAETERYWCGIQHRGDQDFIPPAHHQDFVSYGDQEALRQKYQPPGS